MYEYVSKEVSKCYSNDYITKGVTMGNIYYTNLLRKVIEASESDNWESAVEEWVIFDCEEDNTCSSFCLCGKENLRYLFTIKNTFNSNELFPIGSSCIKKFGRKDLDEITSVYEDMFRLLHAEENGRFISLNSELFSRKLLRYLFEEGAFDNEYNGYDGENDYYFMLDMFNKRHKESITERQNKKIRAIIVSSIRPYLVEKLQNKTNM